MLSQNSPSLLVAKPTGWIEKRVTLDYKAFFKSLSKAALKGLTGHWAEAISEVPEIAAAVGLADTPEDRTWVLLRRAIARAAILLLQEYAEAQRLDAPAAEPEPNLSEPTVFTIYPDFFERPLNSDVIQKTCPAFSTWLQALGIPAVRARNIADRLPSYFALAVHNEWRSNPEFYQPIREALVSPFSAAVERELGWRRYNAYLASLVNEGVFGESFSLTQIYIEPRGFFISKNSPKSVLRSDVRLSSDRMQERKEVVVLLADLRSWLDRWDRDTSVRVLSGGPGAGKSSLAKIFAEKIANERNIHTVLVPLYKLDTKIDFRTAVGSFVADEGFLLENPIDTAVEGERFLLILDGLDELEMQGKSGQDVAQAFIREVIRTVDRVNSQGCKMQVLISGRELAVQTIETEFRKPGQVLHVLPYHVTVGRYRENDNLTFHDPKKLLEEDQRDAWWQKFGYLTGIGYQGIPDLLKEGEIGEVTAQPLLNYLVALAYRRGGLELSPETNLNSIFGDLVHAVYERGWAPREHPAVRDISEDTFFRLLEEVALAVWHGDGRTTTLREIEEHCKESNILNLIPALEQGASSGISALLLAFYFRQEGRRGDGDKTFEFTHKSFGEYLTGLRIPPGSASDFTDDDPRAK